MKSLYFNLTVLDALSRDQLILPSPPGVALQVSHLCQDLDLPLARVAREIARDPAIAARLMRVANSAAYAGRPVDNLQQAVARLGLMLTRTLVSRFALQQLYVSRTPALAQRLHEAWARSIEVAAIASVLARAQPHLNPATAMLAGLLREIGVLPLIRLAEAQPELLDHPAEIDDVLLRLQARVGVHLLRAWNFLEDLAAIPQASADLARHHDGPADYADVACVAALQEQLPRTSLLSRLVRPHVPALDQLGLPQRFDLQRQTHARVQLEAERLLLAA